MHQTVTGACRGDRGDGSDNCCQDKTDYLKQCQELPLQTPVTISSEASAFAPWAALLFKRPAVDLLSLRYLTYKPPRLLYNRVVILQTFLC